MRILYVSPTLPTDVCRQVAALARRGLLWKLYTSTAVNGHSVAGRLLNRWMDRRRICISDNKLRSVMLSDFQERYRLLAGKSPVEATDARFRSVDRAASHEVNGGADAVYCREDAACHTFQRAGEEGIMRIYDLPTAHYAITRDLIRAELESFPELADTFPVSQEYDPPRLARKEDELRSADHIICPSQFVKRSLSAGGVTGDNVHVLPFACNPAWLPESPGTRDNTVLYVGQVSTRKGVHRLLRVWKRLGAHRSHQLKLIGDMRLPNAYLAEYRGLYEHIPALPRAKLVHQYAAAKLFVANSMSEGMAIVIPEALSTGTPVVASRNSGAEEIVTEGVDGLLVSYGDDEALGAAIDSLLASPQRLAYMSERAAAKARDRTWDAYESRFLSCMQSILGETSPAVEEVATA